MIKTEIIEIYGKKFNKTYSDSGMMIEREGIQYSEAIDPLDIEDRVYTETDTKIKFIEPELF